MNQSTNPVALARERRNEFMQRIGSGGVAIVPAAPMSIRNSDVDYEYRQDSDFYYLTGFEEPNAVAIINPDHPKHKFTLFVQPKDRKMEVWTGWRAGEEGAKRDYFADAAFTIDKLDKELPKLIGKAERLYYRFGNPSFDNRVVSLMPTQSTMTKWVLAFASVPDTACNSVGDKTRVPRPFICSK